MKRHHPSPDDHPPRSSPAPPKSLPTSPPPQSQASPSASKPESTSPTPVISSSSSNNDNTVSPTSATTTTVSEPGVTTPTTTILTVSTASMSAANTTADSSSPSPQNSESLSKQQSLSPSSATPPPQELIQIIPTEEIALLVRWGNQTYPVELSPSATVTDLKEHLFELTEVRPMRQKVLGLPMSCGRLPNDTIILSELKLKPEHRLILVGSREKDISAVHEAMNNAVNGAAVVNDLDFDYMVDDVSARALRDHTTYRRRLERRIESTEVRIMNAPREGKKLLVLDLDHTLFDCRGTASNIADLGRPGLHPFLASVYRFYDIVIWSQTSWRWLEAKLTGLNMVFSDQFKISFVLDRTSMFSVTSRRGREERTHEVKALEIIWRKFPERWNASNTIHIDDISRNFALNPQSGLKIHPFRNANVTRNTDRELPKLEHYLTHIATNEQDFTKLKHKHWKHYCARRIPEWSARYGRGDSSSIR